LVNEKVTVKAQLSALLHVSLSPSCLVATLRDALAECDERG
jgi:hypothetical protein